MAVKLKKSTHRYPVFLDNAGSLCFNNINITYDYTMAKKDLTDDDWETVEPKYNWDKIIEDKVLCIFSSDESFKDKIVSILTKIDGYYYYYTTSGLWFKYCKPFNPEDFNIAKDLKEYEK